MSLGHNTSIVTNGLTFCYDIANNKNFNTGANFIVSPTDMTNSSYWSYQNSTATSNSTVAPDGTMTGYLMTATASPGLFAQGFSTATIGIGQQYSSIYAKTATSNKFTLNSYYAGDTEVNITFTLTGDGVTQAPSQSAIESVGNGWYLCTIFTPMKVNAGTTFGYRIWPASRTATANGNYFWGPTLKNSFTDLISNNDLTPVGNLSYSAENSGSLVFDGSTNYLTVADDASLNPTSAITLEVWVNFSVLGTRQIFFGKGDGATNPTCQYWIEKTIANNIMIYMSFNSTAPNLTLSNTTIASGVWYHVVATYDGSTIRGYINGVADSNTYAYSGTLNTTSLNMSIGRLGTYNSAYLNGNISTVRIYNKALTSDQVVQNFNALRGRYGI